MNLQYYRFIETRNVVLSVNAHNGLVRPKRAGGQEVRRPYGMHGRGRRLPGGRRADGKYSSTLEKKKKKRA